MTGLAILPVVEKVLRTNFNRPIHISHTEQISEEERRAALEDGGQWGLATFRPRVLVRLATFLGMVDGRYPAIQTTASRLPHPSRRPMAGGRTPATLSSFQNKLISFSLRNSHVRSQR